jgi:predicted permease
MLETTSQDLRYGLRQLRKSAGFTTTAVVTLALGIAVNATMFSLVSAILIRRPPGRDPARIAAISGIDPAGGFQADASSVSAPNYLAWREANHVFADVAAADEFRTSSLTSQRESEAIRSAAVSANYFNVLGVNPQLGRTFATGEDQPGRAHVVILSHELWQRHFGSDASLLGRPIRLNREDYTVIGVMPPSFRMLGFMAKLWTPLVFAAADESAAARRDRSLYLFARLKPGVDLEQARAEMATLARQTEQSSPDTDKGWGVAVRTLPDFLVYGFGIRSGLAVIMTTVGFVLVIACGNVSGLLLARAVARRKELAIRLSLGAGPSRIIRQLLTEGLLIALFGGGIGLLLAYWGIEFVRSSLSFNEAFNAIGVSLDTNVLLFCTAISMLCAVLCALAPSLRASRADITTSLKDETRTASPGRSHARLRTLMVTGEIALALFLLVGTGLLFLGVFRIEHQNLGFQSERLLTAGITLDDAKYGDAARRLSFVRDLVPRLDEIPGAEAVAISSDLPATLTGTTPLHIDGQSESPTDQGLTVFDSVVTPDYFRVAGISLLRGRIFTDMDDARSPRVVLVNQKFVDRYLHGQEPMGKRVRLDAKEASSRWSQIIGVVGNVKTYSETTSDDPAIYEAFAQRSLPSFFLMLRARSDPSRLASAVRNSVAQMDAELPLAQVMTMTAVIDRQKGGTPFFVTVLATFALLAMVLSAIGIYGLIAYSVDQRSHEIGIRMALGARRQDVLRMVLREGVKMTLIGGAIGLVMSLPLPKVFAAIFYDLHVAEPRIYILVPITILMVAVLATYIPAQRAARLEPTTALRQN